MVIEIVQLNTATCKNHAKIWHAVIVDILNMVQFSNIMRYSNFFLFPVFAEAIYDDWDGDR